MRYTDFLKPAVRVAAICGVILLVPTTGYGARVSVAPGASMTPSMSSPRADTTAPLDTGAFAEAPPDFWARSTDPAQCQSAVEIAEGKAWRTYDAQMVKVRTQYTQADTPSTAGVAVARACGKRFTGNEALFTGANGLDKLKSWFKLALWANQDSLARAILSRIERQDDWNDAVKWAIHAYLYKVNPARLAAADTLADSLAGAAHGTDGALSSMWAHWHILEFVKKSFNREMIHREAEKIYALHDAWSKRFTDEEQGGADKFLLRTFETDLLVTAVDHPDSLTQVAERLRRRINAANAHADDSSALKMMSTAELIHLVSITDGVVVAGRGGKTYPSRVSAQLWRPAAGRDTVVPAPGKVSLTVFLPAKSPLRVQLYGWAAEEEETYAPINNKFRDWLARYGSCGLALTVVASPQGTALGGVTETPEQIANAYAWYYQQSMHLPVTVAIDTAPRLPSISDGRIYYAPGASRLQWGPSTVDVTTNHGFGPWRDGSYYWRARSLFILTDRTGQVLWLNDGDTGRFVSGESSSSLDALLERECARPDHSPHH